jgi:hypothetical protein
LPLGAARIVAAPHDTRVKTKNRFYDMRGTLDQLEFNVVKDEPDRTDNRESKVYLSKPYEHSNSGVCRLDNRGAGTAAAWSQRGGPHVFLYTRRREVTRSPELTPHWRGLHKSVGRRRWLATAIERLVDYDDWFVREVEKGLAQVDAGHTPTHEVGARLNKHDFIFERAVDAAPDGSRAEGPPRWPLVRMEQTGDGQPREIPRAPRKGPHAGARSRVPAHELA